MQLCECVRKLVGRAVFSYSHYRSNTVKPPPEVLQLVLEHMRHDARLRGKKTLQKVLSHVLFPQLEYAVRMDREIQLHLSTAPEGIFFHSEWYVLQPWGMPRCPWNSDAYDVQASR